MKRAEAKALAKKYGMRILRAPVTGEAWALYLETPECIEELDALANQDILPCAMEANYWGHDVGLPIAYKLVCPTNWFDLFGWADE